MSAATRPVLKVYGERNTGTGYLSTLLERNLEARLLPGTVPLPVDRVGRWLNRAQRQVRRAPWPRTGERLKDLWFSTTFSRNLGWKHMLVPDPDFLARFPVTSRTKFLTLTKNPYAWLISLKRRPYHAHELQPGDLAALVTRPWLTVGREHAQRSYRSPMAMWSAKGTSYLGLVERYPTLNVRYEDLLLDPAAVIDRVRTLGVDPAHDGRFVNLEASSKGDRGRDFAYYQDYYLNERWRRDLTPELLDLINRDLDPEVVERLGYRIISCPHD